MSNQKMKVRPAAIANDDGLIAFPGLKSINVELLDLDRSSKDNLTTLIERRFLTCFY